MFEISNIPFYGIKKFVNVFVTFDILSVIAHHKFQMILFMN